MRILDYLNKRVTAPQTSALPLISSIVLLSPNSDPDVLQHIEAVGGANSVLNLPCSSSEILSAVLHVLYRRRLVETTFRDLKEINQTERYPYLSIFAQSGQMDAVDDVPSTKENVTDESKNVEESTFIVPADQSYIVVKNNDDWSLCSSMLPRALKRMRNRERRKHPLTEKKGIVSQGERLIKEIAERDKTDSVILKKMTTFSATSAQKTKSRQLSGNERSLSNALSVMSGDSQERETLDLDSANSSPSISGSSSSDEENTNEHRNNAA